jgi:uncharacterized membrane protein
MPWLVTSLPVGLWLVSLGADVAYRSGGAPASWDDAAFFSMFAGLVAALLLAGPGLADELIASGGIRLVQAGPRELRLAVVALYVLNLSLRAHAPSVLLPLWLSLAAVTLLGIAAGISGPTRDVRPVRACPREVLIVAQRRRTARSA